MLTKDLQHPNIAKHMYAVAETTDKKHKYHIVLEYIEGINL